MVVNMPRAKLIDPPILPPTAARDLLLGAMADGNLVLSGSQQRDTGEIFGLKHTDCLSWILYLN